MRHDSVSSGDCDNQRSNEGLLSPPYYRSSSLGEQMGDEFYYAKGRYVHACIELLILANGFILEHSL